jgi:dolichyl-phosphate-mannose--protein O-mannosyl transferase
MVVACIVRFYRISEPDQVVFDEVHFGAFAGQYIRREYYFDVHPPLAKMMNALAAWAVGFKGDFGFDSIGDSYTLNKVGTLSPLFSWTCGLMVGTLCWYEGILCVDGSYHDTSRIRDYARVWISDCYCCVLRVFDLVW